MSEAMSKTAAGLLLEIIETNSLLPSMADADRVMHALPQLAAVLDCIPSLLSTAESYAMQTYDRGGVTMGKVNAMHAALADLTAALGEKP